MNNGRVAEGYGVKGVCVCVGAGEGVEDCGSLKLKRGLW